MGRWVHAAVFTLIFVAVMVLLFMLGYTLWWGHLPPLR